MTDWQTIDTHDDGLSQFQQEQAAKLGTPMQAIEFALEAEEGLEFLRRWMVGDVSEWPEYCPPPPKEGE